MPWCIDLRTLQARARFCRTVAESFEDIDNLLLPAVPLDRFAAELDGPSDMDPSPAVPWARWTPFSYRSISPVSPPRPVGNIWLGLSKPHWGIHGTPVPSKLGHEETNGCIHLTNWDANRLAKLVKAGFVVDVKP